MDPPANANHPRANNPQMAARKALGGFKRLLQQELLDQFDRLGKR